MFEIWENFARKWKNFKNMKEKVKIMVKIQDFGE